MLSALACLFAFGTPLPAAAQHVHNWVAGPPWGGYANAYQTIAPCEGIITIYPDGADWDVCTVEDPPCPMFNEAFNEPFVISWSDGGAGGQFGCMQNGQFVPAEGSYITHYKCPSTPGTVSLTYIQDDIPITYDWVLNEWIDTADDAPAESQPVDITVWDITSPTRNPVQKYVMSDAVPSECQVGVGAGMAVFWSASLGYQLGQAWSTPWPQIAAEGSKTLTISTYQSHYLPPDEHKLPDLNTSFGTQAVAAYEPTGGGNVSRQFLLFFPKGGQNHPTSALGHAIARDGVSPTPNWYYYWSQTSANYGDHTYDPNLARSQCRWAYVNGQMRWWAFLGPAVSQGPVGTDGLAFGGATGIDLFAHACRHELQHVANSYADFPNGPLLLGGDDDGDDLLDAAEEQKTAYHANGYDLALPVTYPDHLNYGDGWDDCEDYCMHSQPSWTNGFADSEDWSAGTASKQWP